MVREPIVAGILYPSDPLLLKHTVERHLLETKVLSGTARGLMVPVDNYLTVAPLIAAATKGAAKKRPSRVILLAEATQRVPTGLYLPEADAFATPLGVLPVDQDATERLILAGAEVGELLHLQEHALEPSLPFLAHLFPEVPILPILLHLSIEGELTEATALIEGLGREYLEDALILVSSNTSPYTEAREARWSTRRFLAAALSHDPRHLIHGLRPSLIEGAGPLALLCRLLPQQTTAAIVGRAHHTRREADGTRTAEYAAVVFDLP